jgi:glycosyltransferase involved in cell wall biosynthesis
LDCLTGCVPNDGSHVYLLELAKSLAQSGEIDLVLFMARNERALLPSELKTLAYEVNVPPGRSYRQIWQVGRISRSLRAANIDLWHLPNTVPFFWRQTPTVITIFDVLDLKTRKYSLLRTAYRWVVNLVASRLADVVITVSHNSRQDIAKYLRVDIEKIKVVLPGVGEEFCPKEGDEDGKAVTEKYGAQQFFLFPGGVAKNKNLEGTLLACSHYRRNGGTHSLLVTGDGAPAEVIAIRRKVRDLGLEEHVVFTGSLPRDRMPAMYRAAAAVLYPSVYEGFGLPVLEGMACGTPVITSNTSSLPEAAGNACILVDPRDPIAIARAMNKVTSDSALRQILITRGLERARAFTWSRTASETCKIYGTALTHSRAAPLNNWP